MWLSLHLFEYSITEFFGVLYLLIIDTKIILKTSLYNQCSCTGYMIFVTLAIVQCSCSTYEICVAVMQQLVYVYCVYPEYIIIHFFCLFKKFFHSTFFLGNFPCSLSIHKLSVCSLCIFVSQNRYYWCCVECNI